MALTTFDELKAWIDPALDASRQAEIERCISAASDYIVDASGRQIEQAAYVRWHSGKDALGPRRNLLFLDSGHRPVTHPTGFTLEENGVVLTTAEGYSTTADVLVRGVNRDEQCVLERRSGSWACGTDNIKASYTAGYASNAIPARIKQLTNEIAWLLFQSQDWMGKSRTVGPDGTGATFDKQLTDFSKRTLDGLRSYC